MAETSNPKSSLTTQQLIPNLTAGIVTGFMQVMMAISLASLIFSGPLHVALPRGIAFALITTIIHMLVYTFFGSFDGINSIFQDNPSVLFAVATAGLVTAGLGNNLTATAISLIFVTSLLTGLFLIALGYFKLGGLVRYIPYPVVGGFLAGSGWLLVQGGFGTMASYKLSPENLPLLLVPDQIIMWLPGVVFSAALFLGVKYIRHKLTLPTIIFAGIVIFYLGLLVTGTSINEAIQRGLLLGDIGGAAVWHPLPLADLAQADWSAVLGQSSTIGTILALTAISLLLNISSLELALRRDMNLNRELQFNGLINVLTAIVGGGIGYPALGQTTLRHRLGSRGKLAGFIAIGICVSVLIIGSSIIAYIPKPLLGGLILFLGLDFLNQWAVESRKKLRKTDYAVILFILVVIALAGFLVGVGIGLVLMIVLFVINYSQLDLFHREASGGEMTSHVERSAYHRRALLELGKKVHILELQGFIFFGTANSVLETIRTRLSETQAPQPMFVILDFRRVTGFDSSAAYSFAKIKHLADTHNFTLIFTHLSAGDQNELVRGGLETADRVKFFPDLDRGLEWCEDLLLEISQVTKTHFPTTLTLQLADSGFAKDDTKKLQTYLERRQFAPGDYLMRQGQPANEIIFVEIGQVSVFLELESDKRVRLHTHSMGTVVGELGFFLNSPRSASVIADLNTIAYTLNSEDYAAMSEKEPQLAVAFQNLIIRLLAERLVASTNELAALNR
ncbi:MAG: cyclic nucleotide-binding domain-containing protein [Chloroflexi bacterium]|nr:cyclic nucleotide-binding domain-containing protein [Chloroflexota bacterium]MCC6897140.1 SLC26A/SulP transporter family protein [Anaerolineae bacterium]